MVEPGHDAGERRGARRSLTAGGFVLSGVGLRASWDPAQAVGCRDGAKGAVVRDRIPRLLMMGVIRRRGARGERG